MRLILASASPRRRALLQQLGVDHSVEAADIDERQAAGELPDAYVSRLAEQKARTVAARYAGEAVTVLAADTAVVMDGEDILGKPASHNEALGMLARLSGRSHSVLTGVCLATPGGECQVQVVETTVHFRQLDLSVCKAYLATDEPWDKAGAYAIQGLAGAFVRSIEGSYSNVVGLPLAEVWEMLSGSGIPTALELPGD